MNTDGLKERAEIRKLSMQLSISAIVKLGLMPRFVPSRTYQDLVKVCECGDRSHRKKGCRIGKDYAKYPCGPFGGAMPLGAMYCDDCAAEMDRVMRARAEKVRELRQTGQSEMLL